MLGQQELSVHVKQPVWWQGLAGVVLVGLAAWQPASAVAAEGPPNILLILVDDLGWTDLGCFGSRFYETPHIDRLASQGMKFTQAYAANTCQPKRG
jgi:arylsulfatase A